MGSVLGRRQGRSRFAELGADEAADPGRVDQRDRERRCRSPFLEVQDLAAGRQSRAPTAIGVDFSRVVLLRFAPSVVHPTVGRSGRAPIGRDQGERLKPRPSEAHASPPSRLLALALIPAGCPLASLARSTTPAAQASVGGVRGSAYATEGVPCVGIRRSRPQSGPRPMIRS